MEQGQRTSLSLSNNEKNLIVQFLLQQCHVGVLAHGSFKEAAERFNVCTRTSRRLWKAAKQQMDRGEPVLMRGKARGYQHKDKFMLDEEKVRNLSMLERSLIRKLACKVQVNKSTVGRWVKDKQIRPHTKAIKPSLTELNKIARIRWCLSQIQPSIVQGKLLYNEMHNIIHIDEKWFYMTKSSYRYYLLPDEDEPYRSCKSKRFITKVMFMCVVSRPQFGRDGQTIFDGKFGIFPFTEQVPAQRNSKNRAKGTLETKPIRPITKAVTKACIINQILPAIKAKWPVNASKEIYIQQNNAKPHINHTDVDFQELANSDGFKIHLICQPPNSPDTNVLDLGFFRAIQSLQDDKTTTNIEDLMRNVCSSYEELSPHTLNKVFLTLQSCLT